MRFKKEEVLKMHKEQHEVLKKTAELKAAIKEFDYVEDVDISINIHSNKNYVDTVEKAAEIVDEIFGEHVSSLLSECIVVKHTDTNFRDRLDFSIFIDDTEHNRNALVEEGYDDIIEEGGKENEKISMS